MISGIDLPLFHNTCQLENFYLIQTLLSAATMPFQIVPSHCLTLTVSIELWYLCLLVTASHGMVIQYWKHRDKSPLTTNIGPSWELWNVHFRMSAAVVVLLAIAHDLAADPQLWAEWFLSSIIIGAGQDSIIIILIIIDIINTWPIMYPCDVSDLCWTVPHQPHNPAATQYIDDNNIFAIEIDWTLPPTQVDRHSRVARGWARPCNKRRCP